MVIIKTILVLALSVACWNGLLWADSRGITLVPNENPTQLNHGKFWALIIGINQYQYWPKLSTAVKDAQVIADLLTQKYHFQPENVLTLLNEQATSQSIMAQFKQLLYQMTPEDSLFIYFAGHGKIDEFGYGSWVPSNANLHDETQFIDTARINHMIAKLPAKHVFVVADSCYSGTLVTQRSQNSSLNLNDHYFVENYRRISRQALTSGGLEPVADGGKEGHSIFAYYLLKILQENTQPYISASWLSAQVETLVARNSQQKPSWRHLNHTGDENGEFFFVQNLAALKIPSLQTNLLPATNHTIKMNPLPGEFIEATASATSDMAKFPDLTQAEGISLKTARLLAYARLSETLNGIVIQTKNQFDKTILAENKGIIHNAQVINEQITWNQGKPRAYVTVRMPLPAWIEENPNFLLTSLEQTSPKPPSNALVVIVDAKSLNIPKEDIKSLKWQHPLDKHSPRAPGQRQFQVYLYSAESFSDFTYFTSLSQARAQLSPKDQVLIVKPAKLLDDGTLVLKVDEHSSLSPLSPVKRILIVY